MIGTNTTTNSKTGGLKSITDKIESVFTTIGTHEKAVADFVTKLTELEQKVAALEALTSSHKDVINDIINS